MARADEIGYKPQIESLRAFAVSAVLYTHFFDDSSVLGHLGVRIFFVISGYLITGILLRCRTLHDDQGFRRTVLFGRFYARRIIRIFPPYYLVLGLAWAVDLSGIRSVFWWHAGYASNFLFAARNDWVPWP